MEQKQQHLLLVDDEMDVLEPMKSYLDAEGYRVSMAENAEQTLRILQSDTPSLVVLDIALGEDNGFDLCREIQKITNVAIIFLSGKTGETERIIGLELGADDYMVKPFSPRELLARIRAVLRRYNHANEASTVATEAHNPLRIGFWVLDFLNQELIGDQGGRVELSTGEARLLRVFLDHPNQVLSRDELLSKTQQRKVAMDDRSIDNYVSRIRKKIEIDPSKPRYLKTHWGGGYALNVIRD